MTRTQLLTVGLVTLLIIGGALYYVQARQAALREALLENIAAEKKALQSMARLIDRNGADTTIEEIIPSCSTTEQARFDQLLDTLASLNQTELLEAELLTAKCARVQVQQKRLTLFRLEEMLERHKVSVGYAAEFLQPVDASLTEWQQLIELEHKRTELFSERVVLQEEIIGVLQSEVSDSNEIIADFVNRATEASEAYAVFDVQVDELRTRLLNS